MVQQSADIYTHASEDSTALSRAIIDRVCDVALQSSGRVEIRKQQIFAEYHDTTPEGDTLVDLMARSNVYADIVDAELTGRTEEDPVAAGMKGREFSSLTEQQQIAKKDELTKLLWRDHFDKLQPQQVDDIRTALNSPQANVWKERARDSWFSKNKKMGEIDHQVLRSFQYAQSFVTYDALVTRVRAEIGTKVKIDKDQAATMAMEMIDRDYEGSLRQFAKAMESASYDRFVSEKRVENIPKARADIEIPATQRVLRAMDTQLRRDATEYNKKATNLRREKAQQMVETDNLWGQFDTIQQYGEEERDGSGESIREIPSGEVATVAVLYGNGRRYADENRVGNEGTEENFLSALPPIVDRLIDDIRYKRPLIAPKLTLATLDRLYNDTKLLPQGGKEIMGLRNLEVYIEAKREQEALFRTRESQVDSRTFLEKTAQKLFTFRKKEPARTS